MKSQRTSITHSLTLPLYLVMSILLVGTCYAQNTTCENYGLSFTGDTGFETNSSADWYALQEFTLEFWIKVEEPADDEPQAVVQAFVVKGVSSCDIDGYGFYRYNESLYFVLGGTDICGENALVVELPLGNWTHVAVAVSDASVEIYVNGEQEESKDKSEEITFDNQTALKVGVSPDAGSGFLVGELDEIRIWDTARSAEEIRDNYNVSLQNISDSLLVYWRFEDNEEQNQVNDSSTFARQVTVTGTLEYAPNCEVASCLCDIDEYCVPDNDRLSETECPSNETATTEEETTTVVVTTTEAIVVTRPTTEAVTTEVIVTQEVTEETASVSAEEVTTAVVVTQEATEEVTATVTVAVTRAETETSVAISTVLGSVILLGFCLM